MLSRVFFSFQILFPIDNIMYHAIYLVIERLSNHCVYTLDDSIYDCVIHYEDTLMTWLICIQYKKVTRINGLY